jgi:nucleoside-diphosphate-sugar epimerase
VPLLMQIAAKAGESIYVGDGHLRTSDIHVNDAARLYLAVANGAKPGDVFNGTAATTTTLKELAEAMAVALKVPARSVTREEAEERWGAFITAFMLTENRSSNKKAVSQLGWQPRETDILTDISKGSYLTLAQELQGNRGP